MLCPYELGDSLLVPNPQEWDEVKAISYLRTQTRAMENSTQYAKFMAQLPGFLEKIDGLEALLDEELLDKGVFLPKKEAPRYGI